MRCSLCEHCITQTGTVGLLIGNNLYFSVLENPYTWTCGTQFNTNPQTSWLKKEKGGNMAEKSLKEISVNSHLFISTWGLCALFSPPPPFHSRILVLTWVKVKYKWIRCDNLFRWYCVPFVLYCLQTSTALGYRCWTTRWPPEVSMANNTASKLWGHFWLLSCPHLIAFQVQAIFPLSMCPYPPPSL